MISAIAAADSSILLWVQEYLHLPFLDGFFTAFTMLGNVGLLWIALSVLMLCFPKTRKAGALALCAMLLGLLCTNVILKLLVLRPRPYTSVVGLLPMLTSADPNSFPSGHTCAAFAAAGAWARALPRRWMKVTGFVLAALMGFSRLYVGLHFPSDVLVGALVGLLCSQLVWLGFLQIKKRRGGLPDGPRA